MRASPNSPNHRARAKALYHELPVTPENSRAIRAVTWGLLANLLVSDYLNRWNEAQQPKAGKQLLRDAEKAAQKGLEIDARFSLTHYAQGLIHRAKGERDAALAAFDQAIKLDPKLARAFAQKGSELINNGEPGKALPLLRKAIRLNPRDPSVGMFYWNLGRADFFSGRYKKAIPSLQKAVQERPNLWHNWLYLASAFALDGDLNKAKSVLKDFRTQPQFRGSKFTIGTVTLLEKANPTKNAVVRNGRRKFHEGLRNAGMPAK